MRKTFQPIKKGLLRDRVCDTVRDAIFSGKLRAGDPIFEIQLAREFRVSQATVRDALLQLEQTNLVHRVPSKGTFVTKLSEEDVREGVAVRLLLEGPAAVAAAKCMTDADFRELERLLDPISAAVASNEYFESAVADLTFHRYIWKCSGNKTIYRILDQVTAPLMLFVGIVRSSERAVLKNAIHSHQEIVSVLRAGDPDAIQKAIRDHIDNVYDRFVHSAQAEEPTAASNTDARAEARW